MTLIGDTEQHGEQDDQVSEQMRRHRRPIATIDSPIAMMMMSPCRSAKCGAEFSRQPPARDETKMPT